MDAIEHMKAKKDAASDKMIDEHLPKSVVNVFDTSK
jgi:hypothetical protein